MNDSSSSGEGETPCCAVGATPAGGVNTATSAILNRFQQHPQQKNDVGPSASALSAINPSYTEQPSPLKARKLSTNSSSKIKNNRSRHSKGNPYRKGYTPKYKNKSATAESKTETSGAKRQTSDDANESSPNPLEKKKGPGKTRKKKQSVLRTIHAYPPAATSNNNNDVTSSDNVNNDSVATTSNAASSTASNNSVATTTKSKNNKKKVVLKTQITFDNSLSMNHY